MKRYTPWIATLVAILVLLAGCGSFAAATSLQPQAVAQAAQTPRTPVPTSTPAPATTTETVTADRVLQALEGTLQHIYTQVSPSVVNIRVVQKQQISSQTVPTMPDLPNIPGMPQFRFSIPQQQGPQENYSQALGSGFVWDTQGHIVTNNHVIQGADRISVTFADDTTVEAKLVGADPDSDLAVVKVDVPASQLQPIKVADSSQARVGDLVVAIGNPFGLQGTMTVGFISALGRSLPVESTTMQGGSYTIPDIIQTDAPINPGNSGGVLVDDTGQLVGVPTAIQSPVQASAGIGLAIPSALVQQVVPTLIKSGSYEHSWLGISGTTLTPDIAKAMNLDANQHGALVLEVATDGPANKAGLQASDREITIDGQPVRVGGDVIVAIDDQPVKGFDALVTYLVRSTNANQNVTLTILRDGKEQKLDVTLAARPTTAASQNQTDELEIR